jgi:hypothetical protein
MDTVLQIADRSIANDVKDVAVAVIKKIITGKGRGLQRFTDQDREYLRSAVEFQDTICRQTDKRPCKICINGLVFTESNGYKFCSRCRCGLGQQHHHAIPENKTTNINYSHGRPVTDAREKRIGEKND